MLDTGCLAFGTLETEWFDRLQTAGLLTKEAPVEIATSAAPAVKTEQGRLSHFLFQGHRHERELFLRSNANRLGWEFFTRYNWQICLARGMVSILPRQPKSPPRTTAAAAPDSSQTDISSPATGPPEIYRRACISCHGGGGQGQPGLFPPLAGSDWMQAADPARQIRIVLHGMMGPVSIHGKPFTSSAPFMPAQGAALTDAEVAEVLTWARRKFGGQHAVVSPAAVAAVRQAEKDRRSMWRQSELLAISLTEPITP
jgi:nitrite reductase (NO-forming)